MKYIDLGLPSGNLWAEQNEDGYYTFDEAVAKFGDNMPTKEDFEELRKHCWKRWDNERKGMELMSDNGAKLFMPAAGCRYEQRVCNAKVCGYYWSSSYYDSNDAYYVHFDYSCLNPQSLNYRTSEFSVRLIKRGGTK